MHVNAAMAVGHRCNIVTPDKALEHELSYRQTLSQRLQFLYRVSLSLSLLLSGHVNTAVTLNSSCDRCALHLNVHYEHAHEEYW